MSRRTKTIGKIDRELMELIKKYPVVSGMMSRNQIYGVLYHLKSVIDRGVDGDVVELGCNVGTTSLFIKKFLDTYCPEKKFHVYDSFDGLPDKHEKDMTSSVSGNVFVRGACKTSRDVFEKVLGHYDVGLPIINTGWFKEIPDSAYPSKICFAFFDGDFYTSILDSFEKTFQKIQPGGMILVDDISDGDLENHGLPGAERACQEFLRDKEENYDYTGYPDENFLFGKSSGGAKITKIS